jgi:hypothetical protein
MQTSNSHVEVFVAADYFLPGKDQCWSADSSLIQLFILFVGDLVFQLGAFTG